MVYVSVIVPCYNSRETIKECVESLLNQRFDKKYELIFVDDGSRDNTFEYLKELGKKYKNMKVLRQRHGGPAKARNLGAKIARSNLLVFTDSDCIASRDFINEILKPFRKRKIVGVQGAYKTQQKSLIARFVQYEIEDRYERMKKYRYIDFIGSYACAYRKKQFFEVNGFDEGFKIASGEDPALSFKLSKLGYKLVFNPKAVVYHKHPDTLRKYLKQKFYRAYWRALLYKKFPEKISRESYTPQILKAQILFLYFIILSFLLSFSLEKLVYISYIFSVFLLFSTLPLALKIARKSKLIAMLTPFLLILRTIVFSIGLLIGTLNLLRGHK